MIAMYTQNTDTPTWQTGQDILVRANFNNSEGHLAYSSDLNFRAITEYAPPNPCQGNDASYLTTPLLAIGQCSP